MNRHKWVALRRELTITGLDDARCERCGLERTAVRNSRNRGHHWGYWVPIEDTGKRRLVDWQTPKCKAPEVDKS